MTVRIYPDACIVIDLVLGEPGLRQRLNASLTPDEGPIPEVAYTDLTRLECRVRPLAAANTALLVRYDRFFASRDMFAFSSIRRYSTTRPSCAPTTD